MKLTGVPLELQPSDCLVASRHEQSIGRVDRPRVQALHDEDRCQGYRFCPEACPYERIDFDSARHVAQKSDRIFPDLHVDPAGL